MHSILLITKLTFRESIRNKWVSYFSVAFALLAFLLSLAGSNESSSVSSFDRSAAMLLNVMLLFIPMLGLTLGAQLIAADRENGSLIYLLSQPLTKRQLFCGKAFGGLLAMSTSISGGFAIAGIGIAFGGGTDILGFLVLWVLSLLFIAVCVSVGILISTISGNRSRAIGVAIITWLVFTVLSDLGLMATAYVLRLRSEGIVGIALLNPVEAFKILTVRVLANNLEALGAGGIYLDYLMGALLPLFLVVWLVVVALFGFGLSYWIFKQQEEL